MRLEKLEVFGFKSFADKIQFEFPDAITVVVGPNGAGKSNIVDAVRWVLGEQSPKSLRGNCMQDVIFSGTPGRHPAGYAEVTLQFSNSDRSLPLDFETVAVTRRLYRTGESEYLLNRQSCRLKDIRELFMDTGVGTSAYSVVEQGKVDILLEASPEGRRRVFDEAAGISRYRARRREAELKLARAEQNLLRISDVTAEVQKQVRSVKIQAGRARRYKEYTEELAALRLRLYLNDYSFFRRRAEELAGQITQIDDSAIESRTRAQRGGAQAVELKVDLAEQDKVLASLGAEKNEIASDARIATERLNSARTRIGEADADADRAHGRLREESDRKSAQEHELSIVERDRCDAAEALQAQQRAGSEAEQAHTKAAQAVHREREGLQAHRAKVVALLDGESRLTTAIASVSAEQAALGATRVRLDQEARQTESRLCEGHAALLDARTRASCTTQRIAFRKAHRAGLKRRLDAVQSEIAELLERIAATRQQRARVRSRMDVLAEMQRRREGLGPGARQILETRHELNGIVGLLADSVNADPTTAQAVEAALGTRVDAVVTETTADALAAVQFLHDRGQGPAVLIPLDAALSHGEQEKADPNRKHALSLVRENGPIPNAVRTLLSQTRLVDGIDEAVHNRREGERVVTSDGDLVDADGAIVVGPDRASGPIARKAELDELAERVRSLDSTLEEQLHVLETQRAGYSELEGTLGDTQAAIASATAEAGRLSGRIQQLTVETNTLERRLDVVRSETFQVDKDAGELAAEKTRLEAEFAEARRQRQTEEARSGVLGAAVATAEDTLTSAGDRLNAVRVKRAELAQKVSGLKDRAEGLRRALEDREATVLSCQREIESAGARAASLREDVERHETRLAELARSSAELENQLAAAVEKRTGVAGRLAEVEKEVAELESTSRALESDATRKRFDMQEVELKASSLAERAREDLDVDLAEKTVFHDPESADWDAIRERIGELRQKIERLGSVNVEAIAELEEIEQRLVFLQTQETDLREAGSSLNQAIKRLDDKSEELFFASFVEVRRHFQDIFRKLFGGGRADVFLLDKEDPLNCGIEIIAKPPGKEPQSIALLSGGEKAMTAVALVFAIFRSRPSPFCILDEVDAALDENNIGRFISLLREFLDKSQFVIITHSKKTMAVGDILYGITMQEDGVSKKIEVRFDRIEPLIA